MRDETAASLAERAHLVTKRVRQAQDMTETKVEYDWGVFHDGLTEPTMHGNRQAAIDAFVEHGGSGFVAVKRITYSLPEKCGRDVGERPGWMSPGQYDPCPCVLDIAHEGKHACSCTVPADVRTSSGQEVPDA